MSFLRLVYIYEAQTYFADAVIIPDVAAVFQLDSPVFSCYKNDYHFVDFQMQFKPVGSTGLRIIYRAGSLNPTYLNRYGVSFNDSSGIYFLTKRNVSAHEAGTYICNYDNQPQTAEFVVVGEYLHSGVSKC